MHDCGHGSDRSGKLPRNVYAVGMKWIARSQSDHRVLGSTMSRINPSHCDPVSTCRPTRHKGYRWMKKRTVSKSDTETSEMFGGSSLRS